jgi:hypothetical protein
MHIKSLIQTILLQNKKLILFLNKKAFTPLYICNIFDSKYGAIQSITNSLHMVLN